MSNRLDWESLQVSIEAYFKEAIEKETEIIIKKAQEELVDRIREKTGSIASRVLHGFEYMQDRQKLCITVYFNNLLK